MFHESPDDLGAGHYFTWVVGNADHYPHTYGKWRDLDHVLVGIIEWHTRPDGSECGGFVSFVHPPNPSVRESERPIWQVESLFPLTLSPSILCAPDKMGCGSHGFIQNGRWV